MITPNDVLRLIEQGEGTKLEWKDSRILDNPFKLAKSMTAMANQEGGIILIGVKDDGTIEGMKAKKGHQEHIMNVATDRCEPPITPSFQRVKISREANVYVLTIPKKRRDLCHGVKTREGLVYPIRVGPRIREMHPHELAELKESQPSEETLLAAYKEKAITFGVLLLYTLCYLPIRLWTFWAQGKGLGLINWLSFEALVYPLVPIFITFILTYAFGTNFMKAIIRSLRKISVPYLVSFGVVVLVTLILNFMIFLYPESTRFFFLNTWQDFLAICALSLAIALITITLSYFSITRYFAKLEDSEYVPNPKKEMKRLVYEWKQTIKVLRKMLAASIMLGLLFVTIAIVPIDIATGLFIPSYHEEGESFSHSYYGVSDKIYLFIYSERVSPDMIRFECRFYRLVQSQYTIYPAKLPLLSIVRIPNPTNVTAGSTEYPSIEATSSDISTISLGYAYVSINISRNIDYKFVPLTNNFTHIEFEFSGVSETFVANVSYWKFLENVNVSVTTSVPKYTDLGNGTWLETYTYIIANREEVPLTTLAIDFDRFVYAVVNTTTTKVYSQGQERFTDFVHYNRRLGIWSTIGPGYTLNLTITFQSSDIT